MRPTIYNSPVSGLVFVAVLALPALILGRLIPVVGGPIFGILLGMALAGVRRPQSLDPGIKYSAKKLLQAAIVMLGFEMDLISVLRVGGQSLAVMAFTLTAAFLTSCFAGRVLGIDRNVRILIGVGTAICGGSAIAATAPIVEADDREVAYSMSTIFLFNIVAVFIFPLVARLMQMADTGFGIWAGTAINDTSSVVAAAYSYSDSAGRLATIVKLTRTLAIIPVAFVLALTRAKAARHVRGFRLTKVFPWFVLLFVAASMVRTVGIVSVGSASLLAQAGKYLIVCAMTAIGLNTSLTELARNGLRPIALGVACWVTVAVTSLIAQRILGLW